MKRLGKIANNRHGDWHVALLQRPAAHHDNRCAIIPWAWQQLDWIQADTDDQIGALDDGPFQRAVRENAAKQRVRIGNHALGLVGDERRNAVLLAQVAKRVRVARIANAESGNDDRATRIREQRACRLEIDRDIDCR